MKEVLDLLQARVDLWNLRIRDILDGDAAPGALPLMEAYLHRQEAQAILDTARGIEYTKPREGVRRG
ncbi:MAG TPA: hypothetical protein DCP69_09075 [Candidatus Omnitrophica bacterium]|nr:hypothetical protein [Candidatus Omnitrophota bacterium]